MSECMRSFSLLVLPPCQSSLPPSLPSFLVRYSCLDKGWGWGGTWKDLFPDLYKPEGST